MVLANLLFVVLIGLVLFNNGVQAYIHFEAYPIFAHVGKDNLATYLSEYEKRLTIPLLAPYGLTLLVNLILFFLRPDGISLIALIVVFVLNLSVAPISLFVATPVYNQVKGGALDVMPRLMNINLIRLLITTVTSIVVLYLLYTLLPVAA